MPNVYGKNGGGRKPALLQSHELGRWAEERAAGELRRRGFRVFKNTRPTGHPDLYAQGPDGVPLGVEARVIRVCEVLDPTSASFGRRWLQREKKRRDRPGDWYAWVDRETGAVEFEPDLPSYVTRRAA